jgi:NAD(P)-dependent dehydrogenase (short-subunit alcohol dehydrogenase family)
MPSDSLVTTPFGFASTADDVLDGTDLRKRRAIVTGASSGLGVETARALAARGADVTLAVRDVDAGKRVATAIAGKTGNRSLHVEHIDLADLRSVSAFARGWNGPLHMLVNNAGVMALPQRTLSAQGCELQLAVNHLGHFALALALHDNLVAAGDASIAALTSRGHLRSPVHFDDLHFESRPYQPFDAYGQAKTAVVLFAVEATRRWADDGITANAVFPGIVIETNLVRHLSETVVRQKLAAGPVRIKTLAQGAATTALVAAHPLLRGIGGRYFEDCNEAPVVPDPTADTPSGVAAYAVDASNAERLWELSLRLIG